MIRLTTVRAAATLAVLGAMTLAGCGGGGSQSMGALPAAGATNPSNNSAATMQLAVTLPNSTSGATAQSSSRATILSNSRKPAYIDTTAANSAIVVSVTPQDPSEAAQYGNLTVCYNLYTGGVLNKTATPTYSVTSVGNNASTVTIAVPAPPGTDGFQITQYAGQCGSTPYSIPTPPPGVVGGSNLLAQTPVTLAYMAPGQTNNLNVQIALCTPAPAPGLPCPTTFGGNGPPPPATLAASISIASVIFGTVPITNPIREQGAFILGAKQIGIPIPLEATNAAGTVVPGLTTAAQPLAGAGPFPTGVTVTDGDTTGATKIYLIDAATGAIAQGPGTSVTIHEFNVLGSGAVPCAPANTPGCVGGFVPSDTLVGGTQGDPWIIMLTYTGVDASLLSTVTVTASATAANAALPTPITTTISPQSTVYSAGGTGYADTAAPAAPLSLLQPVAAGPIFFTDGSKVKQDGTVTASPATGTTLTGLSYSATAPGGPFLFAVDNAAAGGTVAPSGLYTFTSPGLAVATPVVTSDGLGHEVTFQAPVATIFATDLTAHAQKLFVVDANGINTADIQYPGGVPTATNVTPLNCNVSLGALPAGVKNLGTIIGNGTSTSFLIADPGNNRVVTVAVTSNTCTIASYATGAAFTGLTLGTGGAIYATATNGQIYYIASGGGNAASLGVATAAAGSTADGPIGQLSTLSAAPAATLAPVAYLTQFLA
ncbi:MAG TPA: hypothetical protein VGP41_01565, partial [Candidatus Lustribacter sp.]|nr:hypothetical protein [Candidatus Lustribacter sp.]